MEIPVNYLNEKTGLEIAIIGLSGCFPKAQNIEQFWQNLRDGIESIHSFTDEELKNLGVDAALIADPNYVKAQGVVEGVDLFDAAFFGISPREAEIMDPAMRFFLEYAWTALENAGYSCEAYNQPIGVYAGTNFGGYLLNIYSNSDIVASVGDKQIEKGISPAYITTLTSYKLNLQGPSYGVQTTCSSSLVALHLACQSLLSGECDIALAGGVSISQAVGYVYQQEGIESPDGHCRAFDAKAKGTVRGRGLGIVVLKRLEEAIADGDCIHAVIKGSAINNDGANKVSYTAPSIHGQAKAIRAAQMMAEVEPETITYIEAHGTGTTLGDPVEVAALTQAFRSKTPKKGFCAIGSVKTNIGHLDEAAGIAGLIKTVLALKHKQIPPSLNFEEPNPQIDFTNSPFYVNNALSEWKTNGTPRRAGVSSFGFGGTNAHVILEEAPIVEGQGSRGAGEPVRCGGSLRCSNWREQGRKYQLLVLSAKTESALETATENLANHLREYPDLNLADVAHTLQVGRWIFNHRRMVICQDREDAIKALQDPQRAFTHYQEPCNCSVVFMFSGQGTQYVNMGRELYESESVFREQVDYCCELLKPLLDLDLRQVLYPSEAEALTATQKLQQTAITQPALFVIEYALAKLWMAWGVQPEAMIGHSIGEYVAATIAGVFSLEDALAIAATRGKLMQQMPTGAMLSIQLPEQEVQQLLEKEVSLAASNAPSSCVVSGSEAAIDRLQQKLQQLGVSCRRLHTSHAFHSQMMSPIIETFTQSLQKIKLNPPQIPFVSNVSGTWITAAEATNPNYWAKHLRQPVRFSHGISELLRQPRILLEVGPGRTLSSLAKHQTDEAIVLTSIRHPQEQQSDIAFLLDTLGQLWSAGVKIDWSGFYANQKRHRIPLPTYPFERQRYWIEVNRNATLAMMSPKNLDKKREIADWFYIPRWRESTPLELNQKEKLVEQKFSWLVFVDTYGIGAEIAEKLKQQGQDVIVVQVADKFAKLSDCTYAINPQQSDDCDRLLQTLHQQNWIPQRIAHFWSVTPKDILSAQELDKHEDYQYLGFWSLLFLAQALGRQNVSNDLKIMVVTSNLYDITGEEKLCPSKATILGPCKVIPKEYSNINCCTIDIIISSSKTLQPQILDNLLAEFTAEQINDIVAYRGNHRWIQSFEPVRLEQNIANKTKLKQGGVYLITGGLGGIGLVLAEHLAKTVQARLVLVGRKSIPEKNNWQEWLVTHDEEDRVSQIIRKLQLLETFGAEVLVISADVTSSEQMQAVITQSVEKFGCINGVIHAAGIAGGGIIQLKTPNIANNVLAPKVKGTIVLKQVLQNINLDFLVLCSSQTSILGEFGQVDYCAANAFLDALAYNNTDKYGLLTISINWDNWQEVGMAVETVVPDKIKQIREEERKKGILPQEGADAFNRILGSNLPHVIISTQDFSVLIEHNQSSKYLEIELTVLEDKLASTGLSQHHPRPHLRNDYVAPRNEIEATLAQVWQQILGIQQIGIYDNFLELGGDSLLATQIISRLHKFDIELPLHSLFEIPTIIEQALIVEQRRNFAEDNINTITRVERSNAQQMLANIDEISNQEVELLLNQILLEKEASS
ncbi:SDR family NAD(P)-dependent oxidoreductase [Nostocaceae cyanobacterium CENA369]|uniref:Phenolphthiocerol/phthiocerol polyketide synthase subunit E n=1 Tax=Dendronalium phyllosphericum CENA369 TaxID=1725256 RepID=A0A8J7LBC7_9NOST|nr:type I polyketide synthase [Dendronalium phyllosphericum]MBH8571747.1 SDR family NAD(P)-dependent oxidoreductase [Dendronalium phyllosphericum CENA369]